MDFILYEVSEYYLRGNRGGTNAWTDTNGAPLAEAAAKEKIKQRFRDDESLLAARRAAAEFGEALFSRPDANILTNFEFLASQKKLTVRISAPFDKGTNGLEEFDTDEALTSRADEGSRQTLRDLVREKAFTLTDAQPILFTPIPGRHGVYLIARKGRVPSEIQPLDRVKDRVNADYRQYLALDMARKAGLAFHTNLTNGLTLKKSFTDLCAAEKVPVVDLPRFSGSTRALTNADPRFNLRQFQAMAEELEPGKASNFTSAQPPSEGGYVFYLKARPPVDESKLKTELPEFVNQLRVYRQNEAFQQWFRKQAEQAKLAGPKRETTIGSPN